MSPAAPARHVVVLGLVVAAATTLAVTPSAHGSAVPVERRAVTAGALTATPTAAIAGEAVGLRGRLPQQLARPVLLQRRSGGTWVTVARRISTASGSFSFSTAARSTSTTYDVLAPATTVAGRTYRAVRTPTSAVSTLPQSAALAAPASAPTGVGVRVTAGISPARPGRTVELQRLTASGWTVESTGQEDPQGEAAFTVQQPEAGTVEYRAVATSYRGAARVESGSEEVAFEAPASPGLPFVTGVSGNGRYFVDQDGKPILVKGDSPWAILVDASPAQMDQYVAIRAEQGFNTVLVSLLGNVDNGGPSNDGATYDHVEPFVGDDPAALNSAYWDRVEHFLARCRDAGITVMAYPIDGWTGTADHAGLAASWTTDQARAYGEAVAARLHGYPNVIWAVGGDYPDVNGYGDDDPRMAAVLEGLRAGGMERPTTIQFTMNTTSLGSSWWADRIDFSFVYAYAASYTMVQEAYQQETPTHGHMPALLGEPHYEAYDGVTDLYLRSAAAWALTSGSPGGFYGSEDVWDTAPTEQALRSPGAAQVSALRAAFEGLDGWQDLVPDLDSRLILSGRGTPDTSEEYRSGSTYVTGARTPDGRLAVLYLPDATRAVTIDQSLLAQGYTATWVDPSTGDRTAGAAGSTYERDQANAAGDHDWLLVLQAH